MKKSWAILMFLCLILALVAGCAAEVPPSSSLPSPSFVVEAETRLPAPVTILHTNDVHGYSSAVDALSGQAAEGVIGLDAVAAVRDAYAMKGPVFLLDAGDATQGIYFATASRGEAAIDIMNAAGYDAMTLGNHEFDYGWFQLVNLIEGADFPVLSQLSDDEASQTGNLAAYTVVERAGVRLGVFGLTTPETQFKSDGGFGRDFGTAEALIAHAAGMVRVLREEEKADYVVCLAHLGVEDMGFGTSYDIRDNVSGIDLIVDGHSHTRLEDIENVPGKTQITSTGAYGVGLGVARLGYQNGALSVGLETLDAQGAAAFSPRADVGGVIDRWARQTAEQGGVVVTSVPFDITVARENERTRETVMGNILTDAMREASGADVALQNGGSIRDQHLAAGDVTKAQLITILPYGNVLQVAEVSGEVLLQALEAGVSQYPEPSGGFAHVSGMRYVFDPALPPGGRIVSATVNGAPLQKDALYTLCTNDFLAAGGDLYTMLTGPFSNQLPLASPELMPIEEALVHYLASHRQQLSNRTEERIQAL